MWSGPYQALRLQTLFTDSSRSLHIIAVPILPCACRSLDIGLWYFKALRFQCIGESWIIASLWGKKQQFAQPSDPSSNKRAWPRQQVHWKQVAIWMIRIGTDYWHICYNKLSQMFLQRSNSVCWHTMNVLVPSLPEITILGFNSLYVLLSC